ncbi:MAG TPA: hypothetical protein VMH35_28040 [Streptosporangiaceae bacterium]|nr:hypothetical protein [Streptosporangiaceae bacterium]
MWRHQSHDHGETDQFYSSRAELAADVAAITRAEVGALIADGVQYVRPADRDRGATGGRPGPRRSGPLACAPQCFPPNPPGSPRAAGHRV